MLDVFADTNSCLDGVKERCIAHGGNRLLMLCKNSPESIRSLHLKRNSNCGSSFFRADLSAGLVRGGEHSRAGVLVSRSTQKCRTERRPRWRRRRPWRPIYSASTGGVRYDLSLPPLSSLSQLANGEKNADNLLFLFSSGRPQA